jgi:hypothetical protein
MDRMQIFEVLKTFRAATGISAPALVNVNQGLDELLQIHAGAALAGFDAIDQAKEPLPEAIDACLPVSTATGKFRC